MSDEVEKRLVKLLEPIYFTHVKKSDLYKDLMHLIQQYGYEERKEERQMIQPYLDEMMHEPLQYEQRNRLVQLGSLLEGKG